MIADVEPGRQQGARIDQRQAVGTETVTEPFKRHSRTLAPPSVP